MIINSYIVVSASHAINILDHESYCIFTVLDCFSYHWYCSASSFCHGNSIQNPVTKRACFASYVYQFLFLLWANRFAKLKNGLEMYKFFFISFFLIILSPIQKQVSCTPLSLELFSPTSLRSHTLLFSETSGKRLSGSDVIVSFTSCSGLIFI